MARRLRHQAARAGKPLARLERRVGLGLLHLHQAIYAVTDGRLGHRLLGVPCLLLRTTGRRTGKSRTASLVYARDGQDYLVVGSLGGADRAPGWLHNVRARPQVGVQIARDRFPAVATVIERDDDDYRRLWQLVNENNGGRYDHYQAKTSRPIPIVRLAQGERRSRTQVASRR
ncbi:MAG: nitroreductase family deazaflavin-dependent oxidoreductase [Actinomycetota bacterium]|nr:nitroreductase family deazaflavin-dependent oxidoreductase [Actinomycetota bacterium]